METLFLSLDTNPRRIERRDGRTYFEKDILRVGKWHGSNCPGWDVTPEVLQQLKDNFYLALSRGAEVPINWEHDAAANKLGELQDVRIEGDRLVGVLWVGNEDDSLHLQNNQPKVSVEVSRPWSDGHGNQYPICLTAVAVVNKPVYQGQGPFTRIALSLSGSNPVKRKFKLANGDVVIGVRGISPRGGRSAVDSARR